MEFPGENLIIKLWDTLADKGIGGLLKPWQKRREGRADLDVRREEILMLAQVEVEVAKIRRECKLLERSGQSTDTPILSAPVELAPHSKERPVCLTHAVDVAEQNAKAEAVRREVSVAKAVIYAEKELQTDPSEPAPEKPQDDWLLRWRDCAASVSSEELQQIWGKVLAGEVKSPGLFSLRTLEFLRNLSQAEAQTIERISPFVIHGVVYRGDVSMLEAEGITFSDLLAMQELGVLAGVEGTGLEISWSSTVAASFEIALICHGAVVLVTGTDATKVLKLPVCAVTAMGKQVLRLGSFSPNKKMIESVSNAIKALGFEVQVGSYVEVSKNRIQMFNLQPV